MTAWRTALAVVFAFATVSFIALAFAASNPVAAQVAIFCAIGFSCALFERGRYRNRCAPSATAQPTGERFFDPVSGVKTTVYYDPVSGEREYRT